MSRWWTGPLTAALAVAVLPGLGGGLASAAEPIAEACPAEELVGHSFSDVSSDSVHADSVACLAWWRIARGREDGSYGSRLEVSRAQVASFVSRLVRTPGGRLPASPGDAFTDDDTSVHHFSINRLAEVDVLAGRPGGTFAPGESLTRGQMATVLVRAYEERTGSSLTADRDHFGDDGGSVHEENINKAAAAGITVGVTDDRFDPVAPVSRAQMASFLGRTLELFADAGVLTDSPRTLRDASNLRTEADCDSLLGYFKENALDVVTAYGLPYSSGGGVILPDRGVPEPVPSEPGAETPGAPTDDGGAVDYSDTNVQEEGVDEPDLVKTDGQRLLTVVDGSLRAIDLTGDTPRLTGRLELDGSYSVAELFLTGDRAVLFGSTWSGPTQTVILLVDFSDLAAMRVVDTLELEARILSARMVEGIVRVVLASEPAGLEFTYPTDGTAASEQEAEQRNRLVIEESTIDDWLPAFRLDGGETQPYLACGQVRRPPEFSGLSTLSVLTLDPAQGLSADNAAGVVATGSTVYASASGLYVATARWDMWTGDAAGELQSEIHYFDISSPLAAAYIASGKVPGWLLNQFSMSEHNGVLRVATTSGAPWGGDTTESQVVTLSPQGDRLVELGRVGGLGRGESIFAVRFIGDVGYVVTFRRIDPLYVVDLSNPSAPAAAGELKISGYSAYLHPIGDGLLLGVGQDATEDGVATGTQLSVFDVSNPASPQRVQQHALEGGSSEVEFDHRAFLYWPPTGLAVIPYTNWTWDEVTGQQSYFVGAVGFDVDPAAGISEVGRIEHPDDPGYGYAPQIRRTLVVGDRVFTVSTAGVRASDLHSLGDREWIGFQG